MFHSSVAVLVGWLHSEPQPSVEAVGFLSPTFVGVESLEENCSAGQVRSHKGINMG